MLQSMNTDFIGTKFMSFYLFFFGGKEVTRVGGTITNGPSSTHCKKV